MFLNPILLAGFCWFHICSTASPSVFLLYQSFLLLFFTFSLSFFLLFFFLFIGKTVLLRLEEQKQQNTVNMVTD